MKKILLQCIVGLVMVGCSRTSSVIDLSSLDCASTDNAQCKRMCTDAGGQLSVGSMTITGPTNFYCEFPASDAGTKCTKSDQCTVFCALTETQLDALDIPHTDGKNIFRMNGDFITNQVDGEVQSTHASKMIKLPETMEQTGLCQDYAIESFVGAYEINNGTATLLKGSQAIN